MQLVFACMTKMCKKMYFQLYLFIIFSKCEISPKAENNRGELKWHQKMKKCHRFNIDVWRRPHQLHTTQRVTDYCRFFLVLLPISCQPIFIWPWTWFILFVHFGKPILSSVTWLIFTWTLIETVFSVSFTCVCSESYYESKFFFAHEKKIQNYNRFL